MRGPRAGNPRGVLVPSALSAQREKFFGRLGKSVLRALLRTGRPRSQR